MLRRGYLILRKFSTTRVVRSGIRCTVDAAFGKFLFVTNTVSSGVLLMLGDLIDQEFHHDFKEREIQRYDYNRLARMFFVGLTMGPVHHYYYKYINTLWPARDLVTISKKILADQFIMSPICIAQFFYTLGIVEGKTLKKTHEEVVGKFMIVYMMDWCIWPPTQFINFYLVPCRYQVLYVNLVTMLYDVGLSYIKYEY